MFTDFDPTPISPKVMLASLELRYARSKLIVRSAFEAKFYESSAVSKTAATGGGTAFPIISRNAVIFRVGLKSK